MLLDDMQLLKKKIPNKIKVEEVWTTTKTRTVSRKMSDREGQ